jgi:serine/threonine protein kinase
MKPERYRRVGEIFHAALEVEAHERAALFQRVCGSDDALRREVESLIRSHEEAGNFIAESALGVAAELLAETEAHAMIGRTIARYQILSLLGAGGMGRVYLAEDTVLGRRVALKFLPEYFTNDQRQVQRFRQEARAASALNHPNILTVYEVGEVNGTEFIATEYIDGETLRARLNRTQLSLREAVKIATQIADALVAAYEAGIVHRDVKPENVMLRRDGYVKVLDFGLAKLTEDLTGFRPTDCGRANRSSFRTNPDTVMGTAAYMSPEQACGAPVDGRTDVWSLGIVTYEMVTGGRPFAKAAEGDTVAEVYERELTPLLHHTPEAPELLEGIIAKALAQNLNARYQSIREMAIDLRRLQRRLEVEAEIEQAREPALGDDEPPGPRNIDSRPAARTDLPVAVRVMSSVEYLMGEITRHKSGAVIFACVLSLSLSGFVFSVHRLWSQPRTAVALSRPSAPILSVPFKSSKFSNTGNLHAVLTPDGRYVAYTSESGGKQSIWLRQLDTSANTQIVPPSDQSYLGLAISHNGKTLYFVRKAAGAATGAIYRVMTFGGAPTRIIEKAEGWIGISPNDRQLSFVRCNYTADDFCSLFVADTDGRNEQRILTRQEPNRIGDNQFSPDGRTIAFAAGESWSGASNFRLLRVDLATGLETPILPKTFFNIKSLKWLPDGDGLVFTAMDQLDAGARIWQVSTTSGAATALTNDATNYHSISLDKAGGKMIATQFSNSFRLYLAQVSDLKNQKFLTAARSFSFGPDNRIIYWGDDGDIWTINRDGSDQRQLTNDPATDFLPCASPNGRYIFFTSNRTGSNHIWRMNSDGSDQVQITEREGGYVTFVTPDQRWVYFTSGLHQTLWRVSTEGGEESQALEDKVSEPAFSPDGQLLAYFVRSKETNRIKIVVMTVESKEVLKTFTLGDEKSDPVRIVWAIDNQSFEYISEHGSQHSLWHQSLGKGSPRLIADLGNEQISDFELSPDGNQIALTRGTWIHEAVLIEGLR